MMPLGAPSISKYGSLVRPDAQIVALRLRRPHSPKNTRHLSSSMAKQQSQPVVHVTPFKCPTISTLVCSCVLCWER